MRSLRSGRKTGLVVTKPNKVDKKCENVNPKMCNKRSKPGKPESRKARPALADKTNSDGDANSSSNLSAISTAIRPKRKQNLPAKYQDHELTPIKNNRPECSSTPLTIKTKPTVKNSPINKRSKPRNVKENRNSPEIRNAEVTSAKSVSTNTIPSKPEVENKTIKQATTPIYKKNIKTSSAKQESNCDKSKVSTPLFKKKVVLLEKPKIQTPDRLALYEFDFDPSEEPTQVKKKKIRKKNVVRKKTVKGVENNDDAALQALIERLKVIQEKQKCKKLLEKRKMMRKENQIPTVNPTEVKDTEGSSKNDHFDELVSHEPNAIECLSPIPRRFSIQPSPQSFNTDDVTSGIHFNRSEHMSSPVASSSMIVKSAHKAAASPWRVNGESNLKKWPLNFHVKPSMTPSYERDTVHVIGLSSNREDNSIKNKRSHVYTNIGINNSHDDEQSASEKKSLNWKQTSILSFYEESFKKSNKKKSLSPKKNVESYDFDALVPEENEYNNSNNESQKCLESTGENQTEKVSVENCFGFDDSSEFDQENVSPAKSPKLQNINTIRGTFKSARNGGRGILKDVNKQTEKNLPMRVIPTDILNMIEKQKFMEDIEEPLKELDLDKSLELANNSDNSINSDDENDEPVTTEEPQSRANEMELFAEPMEPELIHFSKPSRRSYETRKRPHLTFMLPDKTKNNDEESDYNSDDSDVVEKAKKTIKKKKKQTTKNKKEEKEIENWAAGFNSVLEEVEDFALCVE